LLWIRRDKSSFLFFFPSPGVGSSQRRAEERRLFPYPPRLCGRVIDAAFFPPLFPQCDCSALRPSSRTPNSQLLAAVLFFSFLFSGDVRGPPPSLFFSAPAKMPSFSCWHERFRPDVPYVRLPCFSISFFPTRIVLVERGGPPPFSPFLLV